jgi:hypothetical protein
LALLVGGCSKTEFVYRHADWFIERWTDDLVDLGDEQGAEWRVVLDQALDLHREAELPAVIAFLGAVEKHAARGLSAPAVECLMGEAEELYRRHARLAVEVAVPLLVRLSPPQLEHLQRRLEERNEDYREEHLSQDAERRAARRAGRFNDRIERWTGRLEPEQQAFVGAATRDMPELAEPWLRYREERQGELLEMLRAGAGADALRPFLEGWWIHFSGQSTQLAGATREVRLRTVRLLSDLDLTLDPEQRETLTGRVGELRRSLQAVLDTSGGSAGRVAREPICTSAEG